MTDDQGLRVCFWDLIGWFRLLAKDLTRHERRRFVRKQAITASDLAVLRQLSLDASIDETKQYEDGMLRRLLGFEPRLSLRVATAQILTAAVRGDIPFTRFLVSDAEAVAAR